MNPADATDEQYDQRAIAAEHGSHARRPRRLPIPRLPRPLQLRIRTQQRQALRRGLRDVNDILTAYRTRTDDILNDTQTPAERTGDHAVNTDRADMLASQLKDTEQMISAINGWLVNGGPYNSLAVILTAGEVAKIQTALAKLRTVRDILDRRLTMTRERDPFSEDLVQHARAVRADST